MNRAHSGIPNGLLDNINRFWRCAPTALLLTFLLFLAPRANADLLICPTTIENDPAATPDACGVLLNIGPNLQVGASATGTLAYNGSDSTFGVINSSGSVISSLFLSGAGITNFTFDGITSYISANGVPIPPFPNIGYGYETYHGPSTMFSNVNYSTSSLLLNFTGGLLPGSSTYFSLPGNPISDVFALTGPNGAISATSAVPEPGTGALALLGVLWIGCWACSRWAGHQGRALLAKTLQRRTAGPATAGALLFTALLSTPAAQAAEMIMLPSSPQPEQVAVAQRALKNGAFVAMTNAAPATFSSYFNVHLPLTNNNPEIPLRYCVVATHRGANGTMHTYSGKRVMPGEGIGTCLNDYQDWAAKEQLLRNDAPTATAWTELSVTTLSTSTAHDNKLQDTIGIYRANSNNSQTDYYMVTKQIDSTPNLTHCAWGGSCNGFAATRGQTIATDIPTNTNGYGIFDHGPLSANNVTTNGFSVGGGISGLTPGVSASFGKSWTQQNVSTTDLTSLTTKVGSWKDDFSCGDWSNPPDACKHLWESNEAVIFQVPVGTPSFNVTFNDYANFGYDNGFITSYEYASLSNFIAVFPPSLSVQPANLRIFPGQTATFDISALISGSTGENLSWVISNVPLGMNVAPLTGSGTQTVQVQVPSSAPSGLFATLSIDTLPSLASPEVRRGPIQLPITVVTNSDVPPGVLLTGGTNWGGLATASAEIWNPATQQSAAAGPMTQARVFHTATMLNDDRIFLTGGLDDHATLTGTTEFYTPATRRFTAGPNLLVPRTNHTASLLADGTVLITGGEDVNGNGIVSAELYNPADNTSAFVGSMSTGRMNHTATVLPNNTVMISGGIGSYQSTAGIFTSEIFDPNAKTFGPPISMGYFPSTGFVPTASTLLPNGWVLVALGQYGATSSPSQGAAYVTPIGKFAPVRGEALNTPTPSLVSLPGGSALLLGESAYQSTGARGFGQLWVSNGFQGSYPMQENRVAPEALLLRNTNSSLDGSVVVAGGVMANTGSSNGTAIEAFNPANSTWSTVGNMSVARAGHTATLIGATPSGSATTISSSLNPAIVGQSVTLTSTVTTPGTYVTGTVTFNDGSTALGTVSVNGGTAQFATSTLSVGTHVITAFYSGNTFYGGSTSPILTQIINPVRVTPVFSDLTSQTITYGTDSINLGGTLSAPGPIYPSAGATVSAVLGGIGVNALFGANGTFSYNNFGASGFSVGTYPITYTYAGDVRLAGAKGSTSLVVVPATPTFSGLTPSQTIPFGAATVLLTGTIKAGYFAPQGSVIITISNVSYSSPIATDGSFSLKFDTHAIPSAATPYTITYSYAAAGNFAAASNTTTALTVTAPPTPVFSSLTAAPASTFGAPNVTLTGVISAPGPVYPAATETVAITIGTVTKNATVGANGAFSATFSTGSLVVGLYSITYSYAGSALLAPAKNTNTSLTVNKATPTFSNVTVSQTIPAGTASIPLSGNLQQGGAIPTGLVSITINNVSKNAQIGSDGTFSTSFETGGIPGSMVPYTITYQYAGDNNFTTQSDVSTRLTVTSLASNTALASSINPSVSGQMVTFTATVTGSGGTPSGTVIFKEGSNTLGSGTLNNGSATFTISSFTVGAHSITAVYNGSNVFLGSTSSALTQTVNSAVVTAVFSNLTASQTIAPGTANITLSGVIAGPGPVYPTLGENVSITIGGVAQSAAVGPNGAFSFTNFPTGTLNPGGSFAILYSYAGDAKLTAATDSSTALTIDKQRPVFSNLTTSQVIPVGTASINLSGKIAAGSAFPTGTVSISILDVSIKAAIAANGTFSATYDTHSISASGTPYTITYAYAGSTSFWGANDGTTTLRVLSPSTTVLSSSLNPSVVGQSVTLTATVTGPGGTPVGSVNFLDGTTSLGQVATSGGKAQLVVSTLAMGSHSLTAIFGYGDGSGFASSLSPLVLQVVNPVSVAPLFSSLTAAQSIVFGTAGISLSGVISAPGPLYPAASETVSIKIGAVSANATIGANGAFSISGFPTAGLVVGTYPIAYSYAGNSKLTGANDASTTVTIYKLTPVFSNLSASQAITFGTAAINLSGTIAAGNSFPTGTVSIAINDKSIAGLIGANGVFSVSFDTHAIPVSAAPYIITYSYAANSSFNAANDKSTSLTVNAAGGPGATTMTFTASAQQCVTGSPFQLFISVKPTPPGTGMPQGQVALTRKNPDGTTTGPLLQFLDSTSQWNPDLNGTSDSVPPGTYTYFATYQGSPTFQASTAQLQMTCTGQ